VTELIDVEAGLGPTGEDVRRRLISMVERGALIPGQKLGAERELAARLGVSRSTLRVALASLEEAGIVRRVPGRGGGTFLASAKVERDPSSIVGVPTLLREQGFTAGSRVLSISVTIAGLDAAEALGIGEDDLVVDLVRIRLADGTPISLERAVFPAEMVPGLPERELVGSLYELLEREYGIRPAEAIERIEVVEAGPYEASILGIATGQPLLSITRTARDAQDVPFEYSYDLFRADRTRIMVKAHGAPSPESPRLRGRRVEWE